MEGRDNKENQTDGVSSDLIMDDDSMEGTDANDEDNSEQSDDSGSDDDERSNKQKEKKRQKSEKKKDHSIESGVTSIVKTTRSRAFRVILTLLLLGILFHLDHRGLLAKWLQLECTPECHSIHLPFFNQTSSSSSDGGQWRISLRTLCDRHSFSDLSFPLEMTIENLQWTQLLPAGSKIRVKGSGYFPDQILYTLPTNILPQNHMTVATALVQQQCLAPQCNYVHNFPSNFTIEILEATSNGEVHLKENVLLYDRFTFPPQAFKGELLNAHRCNRRMRKYIQIFGWNQARKTSCASLMFSSITGVTPSLLIRGTSNHVTLGPQHLTIELGFGRSIVIVDNKGDAGGEQDNVLRAMLLEGKVPDRYNMTDRNKVEELKQKYADILKAQFDEQYLSEHYPHFTDAALYLITVANTKDDTIIREIQHWIKIMVERYHITPLVLLSDCENRNVETLKKDLAPKIGTEVQCVSVADLVSLSTRNVSHEKMYWLVSLLSNSLERSCLKREPFSTTVMTRTMRSPKYDSLCALNNLTGGLNLASVARYRRYLCDKFKKANLWLHPVIPLFVSDFLLMAYAGIC